MPSFQDSIFLFVLALLLLGPKKLPVLARELGKWLGEFRRASNEFKMQMEEELRQSEQEERRKQIAAIEAAAPAAPALTEPEHPHLPAPVEEGAAVNEGAAAAFEEGPSSVPIATSGELSIMPPATGLPVAQGRYEKAHTADSHEENALGSLLESIPESDGAHAHIPAELAAEPESATHGG